MPGLDRTGPEGKGSRTGQGMGKCNPKNQVPDEPNNLEEKSMELRRGKGDGLGLGRRRGKGLRGGNA